ncbi:MAG: hypothetical protein RLY97_1587 [Pseudomonadota bacterium]
MKSAHFLILLPLSLAISVSISAKTAPKDLLPKAKTASKPHLKAPKKDLADESQHRVLAGETLGGIANRAEVPRIIIAEANGLTPPYRLREGQILKLPRTKHHIVKAGETGFDIAYTYGIPFNAIAVANGIDRKSIIKVGQDLLIPTILAPAPEATPKSKAETPEKPVKTAPKPDKTPPQTVSKPENDHDFFWPVEGKVRRGFTSHASDDFHDGIDIPAPLGTAVRATLDGTVLFAGYEPKSFGNLVIIDHGNGWKSVYAFLSKLTVKLGDKVKRRERVGLIGHSGKATRDELHFELRKDNKPTDPEAQLPEKSEVKEIKY